MTTISAHNRWLSKLAPDSDTTTSPPRSARAAPEGDPSLSPTLTAAATQMGVIVGTAAYMSPGGYNSHYRIVQTPDHVVVELEMMHDARIIPLDGGPHLPTQIRPWLGDSRGHWERDTLVVDTTNFTDKAPFKGSFEGLPLVERFTRVDENTINYEVTVDDPATWTKPWTAAFPLTNLQTLVGGVDQQQVPQMFEYACPEGNYGLPGQLAGARAVERVAGTESR